MGPLVSRPLYNAGLWLNRPSSTLSTAHSSPCTSLHRSWWEKVFFFFSFHPYRPPTLYSAPSFNLKNIIWYITCIHLILKNLVYFYVEILWPLQLFNYLLQSPFLYNIGGIGCLFYHLLFSNMNQVEIFICPVYLILLFTTLVIFI